MGYKAGLAVAVAIGVAVAAFPLYAGLVAGHLWSWSPPAPGGRGGEEAESTQVVQGVIEAVDFDRMVIVVNGLELRVLGSWVAPNGTEISAYDLLGLLKPGDRVTVAYSQRGRWGYVLEEITLESTGERFTRLHEWG